MSFKKLLSLVLTVALAATLFAGCGCGKKEKAINEAIDKESGYEIDKYIELGKYTGFDYDIDQAKYDALLEEKTYEATSVDRAAKKGDEIEFSYTGYIKGKKVDDLSQDSVGAETSNPDNDYKKLTDALIGKKVGDKVTVKLTGKEASKLSNDNMDAELYGNDYSSVDSKKSKKKEYKDDVTFKLKVKDVSKVNHPKVTEDWVKNESNEDVETVDEFFQLIDLELKDNAREDLWEKAVNNSKMLDFPQKLYDKVKEESENNDYYDADEMGMSLEEYHKQKGDTEESLERQYMKEVQSTLVAWAICKHENITVSEKEIEQRYKDLFDEIKEDKDTNTLDKVKKKYSKAEIKEAVYMDKAKDFVYDHSNVTKSYKQHNNK